MSNEELVAMIQAGERDKLAELWEQVRRFALKQGRRWLMALDGRGGVTHEDLQQYAFLALMEAADSFDPDLGKSFIGWYVFHLKTAFSDACCIRTQLQRRDPIHHAASMEAPITDDESDPITLGEAMPDPAAEAAFEALESLDAVAAITKCLTDEQRAVVMLRYVHGLSMENVANTMGIETAVARSVDRQAMRTLRHPSNRMKFMKGV